MYPKDMPAWESDFWRDLLDEANDRPMGAKSGRFASGGWHVPTEQYYDFDDMPSAWVEPEHVSEYWTEDTLVGEIVEDEPLEISA